MTVLVERRRDRLAAGLVLRALAVWFVVMVLLVLANWPGIRIGAFIGPDDLLRMQQVRDLIGGQGWFDVHQYRIDAANGGVPMHWSRLVDIPLAAVMLAFTPLVGAHTAEIIAGVAVPAISLFLLMLLAARVSWTLLGAEAATLTALSLALPAYLVFQFSPMRVDHHAWQVVLALLAVNGMMSRSAKKGGWAIGLALAGWLAISLEGLPMAAVFCALMALRWLRRAEDRWWLVHTMDALALGSIALFLLTRGFTDLAPHCDAVSPFHVLIFIFGAGAIRVLARPRLSPLVIVAGLGAIGAASVGIVLAAAPSCVAGGFGQVDPVVQEFWFTRVNEGTAIWTVDLSRAVGLLLLPVIGLGASVHLYLRSQAWLRTWWLDYTLLLLAAILVGCLVIRATVLASALAAIPLGFFLGSALARLRAIERPVLRIAGTVGLVLLLSPMTPGLVGDFLNPAGDEPARKNDVGVEPSLIALARPEACRIDATADALNALPPGEMLALIDTSSRLVFRTNRTVVATSHHRGDKGMRFAIDAYSADPETAHRMLLQRGVAYVAICRDHGEIDKYAERNENGLAAALDAGKSFPWLQRVAIETPGTLQVWRVLPAQIRQAGSSSPRR